MTGQNWNVQSKSFKNELVNPLYKNFEELNDFPNCKNNDEVARMLYWDAVTYLPDDILVKLDRAAMYSSLETRVPFLDERIISLATKLPYNQKIII